MYLCALPGLAYMKGPFQVQLTHAYVCVHVSAFFCNCMYVHRKTHMCVCAPIFSLVFEGKDEFGFNSPLTINDAMCMRSCKG